MSAINLLRKNGVEVKTVGIGSTTPTGKNGIQIVCDIMLDGNAEIGAQSGLKNQKSAPAKKAKDPTAYSAPTAELFNKEQACDSAEKAKESEEIAEILLSTLSRFNINACVTGIESGPRFIRYEIMPAKGVRVSAITSLYEDLALAIGREGMRIEAPVPGKSAIGIEIPTKHPRVVPLGKLLAKNEFTMAKSKTTVCIGEDVAGEAVFCDIAKAPHLLIAGSTGMGKSVLMNSILASMLCKATPADVKFILIDTKRIEFSAYSNIPHLLTPVIFEPEKAEDALMWAIAEMSERYLKFEQSGVKNIDAYNDAARKHGNAPIPKIIIVIDELADLMYYDGTSIETAIAELAQKARAVGIHLIIGTQRPTPDVLTGILKANIPSRISFKVASGVESRTVLDRVGAEKLLKSGDMLFNPNGAPKPIRVQGAYISDGELTKIIDFIEENVKGTVYDREYINAETARKEEEARKAAEAQARAKAEAEAKERAALAAKKPEYANPIKETPPPAAEPEEEFIDEDEDMNEYFYDDRFIKAVEMAIEDGKISASVISRKLSIGPKKSAKFIEAMEEFGIVTKSIGTSQRTTLITLDGWREFLYRIGIGR